VFILELGICGLDLMVFVGTSTIQNNKFVTVAADNAKMKTKRSRNQNVCIGGTYNINQTKSQRSHGLGNTSSSASMALMIDEIMKQDKSTMHLVKKKLNPDNKHKQYQ
jgi:ribosomal protein L35